MCPRQESRRDEDKQLKIKFLQLIAAHEKVTSKMYTMLDRFFADDEDSEGVDLTSKLFAHYKCNDNAANTTVTDSTGTHNAVTRSANTSTITTTGKVNEAFHIDATSTKLIDITGHADFDLTGTYAISLWFNPDVTHNSASAQDRIIQHSLSKYLLALDPDGNLEWGANDGVNNIINSNSASWTGGTWYHVVVQWDGAELAMWVDGTKQTETQAAGSVVGGASAAVIIGASGIDTQIFDGIVDDIRFFNDSLTLTEIAFLYNSGNGTENNS